MNLATQRLDDLLIARTQLLTGPRLAQNPDTNAVLSKKIGDEFVRAWCGCTSHPQFSRAGAELSLCEGATHWTE